MKLPLDPQIKALAKRYPDSLLAYALRDRIKAEEEMVVAPPVPNEDLETFGRLIEKYKPELNAPLNDFIEKMRLHNESN